MSEYVRVKDRETGHHVSILRSQYDRNPDPWQELKSDATYRDGSPVPPKFKTTVESSAAKKSTTNAGQTAETDKE